MYVKQTWLIYVTTSIYLKKNILFLIFFFRKRSRMQNVAKNPVNKGFASNLTLWNSRKLAGMSYLLKHFHWSIFAAKWLVLLTLNLVVTGTNTTEEEIMSESEWHFIAQSPS